MARKLFVAGNWKMNKTASEAAEMVTKLKELVAGLSDKVNIAVCPTFTALERVIGILKDTEIGVGAQDVSDKDSGAYTGEISTSMLSDLGVKYVIVGHSERRQYHQETDESVSLKAKKVLEAGLLPIVCIGESLQQREGNETETVITSQVKGSLAGLSADEMLKTTIAYEPIWAIGTGKTATPEQAQEVHVLIRKLLAENFGQNIADQVIIQYGGSVKPANSKELLGQDDIDGALVGGASLEADTFAELIKNALD